jgi:hypothetical protein
MMCQRNGITGFPSYLIKSQNTEIILGGYQNLTTFHKVIERLSDGHIKPKRVGPSLANVMEFVKRYQSVYPVEIEVAFGLDRARTDLMVDELIASGNILPTAIGDGRRLQPTAIAAKATKNSANKKPTTKSETDKVNNKTMEKKELKATAAKAENAATKSASAEKSATKATTEKCTTKGCGTSKEKGASTKKEKQTVKA